MEWCWNCKIRQYETDENGVERCPLPDCRMLESDDPSAKRMVKLEDELPTRTPPVSPRSQVKKIPTKEKA